MKKVEKRLKKDLNVTSELRAEDVKQHMEFEKRGIFSNLNMRRGLSFASIMAVAILAIVLQFGNLGGNTTPTLASVVTIDINPGLIINLDDNQEVISVEALNADAEALLLDVDLTITDLDEMVESILDAAEEQGFLLEEDTILVSIQSEDGENNDALEQELQQAIAEEALKLGKEFETVMNKYKEILDTETSVISQAKAKLIEAIIVAGEYTVDDIDELSIMKVDELKDILETSYGISIQEVMAEENEQSENGQEAVRAKLVEEILEHELLTIEEIAVMETKDLRDVLKDFYKIQDDGVKEKAEEEIEELDREKIIETLSGLVELTPEELLGMTLEELQDALEEYYESIEDQEDAKEKAKEKAQEAKEKAEENANRRNQAENDAEEDVEEAYDKLVELEEEYQEELAELEAELAAAQSGLVELEAQLLDLQGQLTTSGLSETEIEDLEEQIADLEEEILDIEEDIAELIEEIAELADEYAADVEEVEEDIEEAVAESMEEAHEDAEKAANEANKILSKGLKEYFEDKLDLVTTEEEANALKDEVIEKYDEMLATLNSGLNAVDLTEDGEEDLLDIIEDTQEDYDEFLEEINEFLVEYLEEQAEMEAEAEEDFAELQEELQELVDEYVIKLAELEAKGDDTTEETTEYLEELEELILEIEVYEEMTSGLKEMYRTVTFESLMEFLTEELENPELTPEQIILIEERIVALQEEYDSEVEFEEEEEEPEEEEESEEEETEEEDPEEE